MATTKQETATENRGGARKGAGRKPSDPAKRRGWVVQLKCTDAEGDRLTRAYERANTDLDFATWARETLLALA